MSGIDYNNPGPQIEAHGRLYCATVEVHFYLPDGAAATDAQIEEWLLSEMQLADGLGENPLEEEVLSVHRAEIERLRDQGCRVFTEWGPLEDEGKRHGRRRVVRDGEAYSPVWVEPAA